LGDVVARPRDNRQKDLLRPALKDIIDLGHPLVRLAREIDWGFLDQRFASVSPPGPRQPGLPTRLVAGLFILKHMHNLSDKALCARWLENPYYQFFCGELSFCHQLPFGRSSLTLWRQRLGEEPLTALVQESLSVAHKTGALATRDLERIVVDTTVQPELALAKAGGDSPSDRCPAVSPSSAEAGRSGAASPGAVMAELPARR
jgi:IS5 family transposase